MPDDCSNLRIKQWELSHKSIHYNFTAGAPHGWQEMSEVAKKKDLCGLQSMLAVSVYTDVAHT